MSYSPSPSSSTSDGTFTFKPIGKMNSAVTVSPQGVYYSKRHPNALTWLLVIFTGGLALFAWPWIKFGKDSIMLPRSQISSITVQSGGRGVRLNLQTPTGLVSFQAHSNDAERAQVVLLSGQR
jgi:hypothetical protein